ncbi:MAG: SpaA isopeptide-forming pilin-related protein [Trichococcus sp.]
MRKRFILFDRIVFWLITLMTVMPSFLSAYTAIEVLAADIGTVQTSLPMDDGTASATGTVNGSGTAVDWVVTVTKFDSEDERAPKLELEYSSGLGAPYNISTNVQQINHSEMGEVAVLNGQTFSTVAETLTMSFSTDITDSVSDTVSIKMLARIMNSDQDDTLNIFSSGSTKTLSIVNPIAQAAAKAKAEAEAQAAAEAQSAKAEAEAQATAEAEAQATAEAEAQAAAEAEAQAAAEAEAQAAAEAEAQAAAEAEAQAAAEAEAQAATEAEAQAATEIESQDMSENKTNSSAFTSSFSLVSLFSPMALASTYTDSIAVNKTAVRTLGCRTYEVTLGITGTPPSKPVDIILVLDRSASMTLNNSTRLASLKTAANAFTDIVLGDGTTNNRISVVSFGGANTGNGSLNDATVNQAFTSNTNTVKNTISNITVNNSYQYTNTEAGLARAGQQLSNARAEAEKVIILFSDGVPTISIGGTRTDTDPDAPLSSEDLATRTTFARTTAAGQALWPSARVFSIGLLTGYDADTYPLAVNLLDSVQNSGFYNAPSEADLAGIFEEISTQLNYSATNAVVTDVVGNAFNLVESSLPAGATYNSATRTITWSPGTIYTSAQLKYVVQAKPDTLAGIYPTNESAILNYTDVNALPAIKTFPKPTVNVPPPLAVTLTDQTILKGDSISLGDYRGPITGGDGNGTYTYAWYVDGSDTVISTAENPSVSPTVDTKYKLIVTDSSGCKAIAYMWVRVKTGSLTIRKEDESGTVITNNPATFTLAKGGTTTTQLTAANGFAEFTGLTRGTYTLQETVAPTGYIADPTIYTVTVGLSAMGTVVVTVTKPGTPNPVTVSSNPLVIKNAVDKIDIPVTKVWNDNNNVLNTRPTSITVNIYQNYQTGNAPYKTIVITPTVDGVWSGTFTNLPKYASPNELYVYTVEEVVVDKYTAVVTPAANGFTITNTLNVGSLAITKVDKTNPTIKLPGAIFELQHADGTVVKDLDGIDVRGTTDSDGKITWNKIPYGTYKLVETTAPDGYSLLDEDVEVVIDKDHINVSKTLENVPVQVLPVTGGMGTTVFTLIGLGIMLSTGYIYRKKQ